MKNSKTLALILLCIFAVNGAHAETGAAHKRAAAKKAAPKGTSAPQAKLGTSFKFNGSNLRGKYQSSLSSTATVENDKFMEDLLGGRTQFEDRSQRETERN
ncbi:MAG: hypothetical protein JSU04_06155 [Bdellovibrionales bacterium]|nr:hypothetical protein [Bdellovibrionales bacterium]